MNLKYSTKLSINYSTCCKIVLMFYNFVMKTNSEEIVCTDNMTSTTIKLNTDIMSGLKSDLEYLFSTEKLTNDINQLVNPNR